MILWASAFLRLGTGLVILPPCWHSVVSASEVEEPVTVRYGHRMNPEGANFYSRAGLPASPIPE
jgi:hypothetical protein